MEESPCIGCRTLFQYSEEVQLDTISSEYCDYSVPLQDDKLKWNILRAVISFLNSQGGTIYIGIQSSKGKVKGIFLQRKERDSFKLTFKQLIERIYPKVDLNDRQEVEVHYVPVFRGDNFEGKFVIKIVVQQGDPTQVYCISQRIKLQEENKDAKAEEFQVFYAYERSSAGGIIDIRGVRLMNYIFQKVRTGRKASVFHENCNPQPPYLQIQIRTIKISNINQFQYDFLKQSYEQDFEKMQIDYTMEYDKESKSGEIYIEDEQDFENVKMYLVENIQFLNSLFKDSNEQVNFVAKGEEQHYYLILNQREKHKKEDYKPPAQKKQQQTKKVPKFPYQENKPVQKLQTKAVKQQLLAKLPPKISEPKKPSPQKSEYVILFTHIAPESINNLEHYLRNSIYRAYDKQTIHYFNSLELHLKSEKQLENYLNELVKKENQLAGYGFKKQIRYGICENKLKICNVDWNKNKQMKEELMESMGDAVVSIKNEKNALVCQMVSRQATCTYLDILLNDRSFKKKYMIKGKHDQVPKMKIYIDVIHIAKK